MAIVVTPTLLPNHLLIYSGCMNLPKLFSQVPCCLCLPMTLLLGRPYDLPYTTLIAWNHFTLILITPYQLNGPKDMSQNLDK